jgi:hypothetical protein
MSRASTSGVRRAKAFLVPSGLIIHESKCQQVKKIQSIPDQSVDLDSVNIVQLLKSLLDLSLVGLNIHDEDKGVVLLNLLHGALSVERVDDDILGIEAGDVRHRLARVLWCAGKTEGLGAVEGRVQADLANLVRVNLFGGTSRQR